MPRSATAISIRLGLTMLAIVGLGGPGALAEPVFVNFERSIGQGWATQYAGSCIVAVPKHVVGDNSSGTVIGRGGVRGDIVRIVSHPQENVDLAILWVSGALQRNCPLSGLGYPDSRSFLDSARRDTVPVNLELVEPTGQVRTISVLVDTSDPLSRSNLFPVIAARSDLPLPGQGDSGAPIRDTRPGQRGQPLGMLLTEGNPSRALRFDVIRAFVELVVRPQQAPSQTITSGALALSLVDWTGQLPDARCGPSQALAAGTCPFAAGPRPGTRTHSVLLELPPTTSLSEVRIEFSSPNPGGVEVAIRPNKEDTSWIPVRYCRAEGLIARCIFSRRQAYQLRLTFEGVVHVRTISAS